MSNSNNRMIVFASILGAILATSMLALNPSPIIINAGAQQYGDQYGYDNNPKKTSDVNIQKIKCVNSNLNVNGIDITQVPQPNGLAGTAAEATNEDRATVNTENGNGLDKINFNRNLVNICANVNANEQIRVTEPETASLTVNKQVFGCSNIDTGDSIERMDCQELQDGSSSWLPCIGSSISGTDFCQNLPANLFDIEVLDNQNTQLQEFEGSADGTTIQNLQAGTYAVNEIKVTPPGAIGPNVLIANPQTQTTCVNNGFSDGGVLFNTIDYNICFEYEDEQDNDCSTLTLAAGENKLCTVKNYIVVGLNQSN